MTSQRKNILVGLTVLGAFVVLGWMIIQFGGRIGNLAAGDSYTVQMQVPRVDGLSEGNQVRYLGQTVGRVESITLSDNRTSFMLDLGIRPTIPVPANVTGVIRATNLISGGAVIDLQLTAPDAVGRLEEVAGETRLTGTFSGSDLVPPEFALLAEEIRELTAELRESGLVENVNQQVTKIGEVADAMNQLVGDEQLRGDIKASVSSIREASDSAARVAAEMEEFSGRLKSMQANADEVLVEARNVAVESGEAVDEARRTIASAGKNVDDLTQQFMSTLVTADRAISNVQQITAKINEGQGTAGKFVNDDRLYEALVDNMRLLEPTIKTLNRLLEQFEEEGIKLRL